MVIHRDPQGDRASHGNAGGIAVTEVMPASVPGVIWKIPGWLLDPFGPLAIPPRHAPRLARWLWHFSRAGRPAEMERIATALSALHSRVYDDLIPMLTETGLIGELNRKRALAVYESRAGLEKDTAEWSLEVGYEGRHDLPERPGGLKYRTAEQKRCRGDRHDTRTDEQQVWLHAVLLG